MKHYSKVIEEDIKNILASEFIDWQFLNGKTFFITGATGIIGSMLVRTLIRNSCKVLALVRNETLAREMFGDDIEYIVGNLENIPDVSDNIDYVIHLAAPTSSKFFSDCPEETYRMIVEGTKNVLELAKEKSVKGFIYTSTMEVYGYPEKGHKVAEDEVATFDKSVPRNSYPLGKIKAEELCKSYMKLYNIPARIVRLTQTFGPGVKESDSRIFAEFLRCIRNKKDIVLHTKGDTERSYLYTADAVTAILTVLLNGTDGEAYSAANESTYCSIREMAELVANNWSLSVKYDIDNTNRGYADTLYMDLDTKKLRGLGWSARAPLLEMYVKSV